MELIYDIFCDASVAPGLRGACAGCTINHRYIHDNAVIIAEQESFFVIQPDGTNNSGELEALLLSIYRALDIRERNAIAGIPVSINIFSDSMISVKGIREWIFNWVYMDRVLYKRDGSTVMNQNYIKLIYNAIVMNRLKINIYHQKGHVGNNYDKAAKTFHSSNGIFCNTIGVTPQYISAYNDKIDRLTRDTLSQYLSNEASANIPISELYLRDDGFIEAFNDFRDIELYRQLIR